MCDDCNNKALLLWRKANPLLKKFISAKSPSTLLQNKLLRRAILSAIRNFIGGNTIPGKLDKKLLAQRDTELKAALEGNQKDLINLQRKRPKLLPYIIQQFGKSILSNFYHESEGSSKGL